MSAADYDAIIIGAGAAGCVLAARLSEMADQRILLIEAGPDMPPGSEPADVLDPFPISMSNAKYRWPDPFIQGFGVGGGSNINGMIAYRGEPSDYDGWTAQGVTGWGWNEVLPYFRKLERDLDYSGPLHGSDGPMPVRRVPPERWSPFSRALGTAVQRHGFPIIGDCHAEFRDGLHAVPMSCLADRRVSAAMAYLSAEVRCRPNLTVMVESRVSRLDIRNRRVEAVEISGPSGLLRLTARETILSCGAVYSPALLLRSGIGPGSDLQRLGLPVRHDLAGVGRNLLNRPKFEFAAHLPRSSMQYPEDRALGQNCLRYSSNVPGCAPHDMGIKFVNRTAGHALGQRVGAVVVCLYAAYSTGSVMLGDKNPDTSPVIEFNLLSDPRDFERLVDGCQLALEFLKDPEVAKIRHEVFLAAAAPVGHLNDVRARIISGLFDITPLRKLLLSPLRLDIEALSSDRAALADLVRRHAGLGWHVSGTCRMGRKDDPLAVLDSDCRVLGLEGLRVVDASIFPNLVGEGGMHFPVLMAAEKMADRIKADCA